MSPSTKAMEGTLLRTLDEVRIRAKVESCLREMVTDVEISHRLVERLEVRTAIDRLRDKVREQEEALEEARAAHRESRNLQSSLADGLVRELWTLSREIGELRAVKADHDALVGKHDEVLARLFQAEEDLEEAKQQRANNVAASTAAAAAANAANAAGNRDAAAASAPSAAAEQHPRLEGEPSDGIAAPDPAGGGGTTVQLPQTEVLPLPANAPASAEEEKDPTETGLQQAYDGDEAKPAAAAAAAAAGADDGGEAIVVALDEEASEGGECPTFEALDTKILMHVFSFLDALDILNTAQVNVSMYSRVDSLFGLGGGDAGAGEGGGEAADADQDNSTIATIETQATAVTAPSTAASAGTGTGTAQQPSSSTKSSAVAGASASSKSSAASAAAATTTASKPRPTATPVAASQPPAKAAAPAASSATPPRPTARAVDGSGSAVQGNAAASAASPTSSAAAAAAAAAARFDGPRALFTSLLQPRMKPSPPSSPARGAAQYQHKRSASADASAQQQLMQQQKQSRGPTQPPHQQQAQPMNAAMANSMAAKLTDAELNAIVMMTERLKQKEALADRLVRENEELLARVDGAEAMREFLAARLAQMEQSLANSEDDEAKVAQQIASDQEVIAFLDGRVQELEGETRRLESEREATIQELGRVREQAEQKSIVMGDMLQFERERLAECERDWKSAKKLLIKEVKNCRAQILALQAERDGYREQNDILRKAVMSPAGTGASHRFHA